MRDQKPRLRKFACLAAIAAMLALSGRAAERDLDDLLLVRLPAPKRGIAHAGQFGAVVGDARWSLGVDSIEPLMG